MTPWLAFLYKSNMKFLEHPSLHLPVLDVRHPEQQPQLPIPYGHSCMVREDEGLGVRDAPGELDVDDDTNDTLEKDSNDGLKHLKDDRVSALITGSSKPISNGSLCLQAKQEGGPKVIDGKDTWGPSRGFLFVRKVVRLQVTMQPEGEVPDAGEDQPGDQAADEQHQQVVQEGPAGHRADRVIVEVMIVDRITNIHAAIFLNNSFDRFGRHSFKLCLIDF